MALADAPGLLLNDPIDWFRTTDRRGYWYSIGKPEMKACVTEAVSFVDECIMPRLDSLRTIEDYILNCESRGIEHFAKGKAAVQVAAGYVLLNKNDAARRMLETILEDRDAPQPIAAVSSYIAKKLR